MTGALGLQWFIFVVSGSVSFIVVAAALLDLQGAARSHFITSVLIVLAVTTLVQVTAGHRLPLFEGPSTPYLAMLVVLVQAAPPTAVLRAELASSLIIAGVVIAVISWVAGTALARLLNPFVVGSFLFLLGVTLLFRLAPQAVGHSSSRLLEPAALLALGVVLAATFIVYQVGPPVLRALIFLSDTSPGWRRTCWRAARLPSRSPGRAPWSLRWPARWRGRIRCSWCWSCSRC